MTQAPCTVFGTEDLDCLDCAPEVQQLFRRVLEKQRSKPFAVRVELPYRHTAWENGRPGFRWPANGQLSDFVADRSPVVGLVTQGVMEIHESAKPTGRKKTTTVLYPGMFFGLFETYADPPFVGAEAEWTITSGIVSFMVCHNIGSKAKWERAGENFDVSNFQFTQTSTLSFEGLLSDNACVAWRSQSVWLKPGLIDDEALRQAVEHLLRRATIRQLTSVVKQNPTWGRVGEGMPPDGGVLLWMQYLDAVIGGDTPIFQLVRHDDNSHLPVSEVVKTLNQYANGKSAGWDILIPKKLEKSARGIHLVDYVSRFPAEAWDCIRGQNAHGIQTLAEKYHRQIAKFNGATFCSVKYRGEAIVSVNCWGKCEYELHSKKTLAQTGRPRRPHPLEQLDNVQRTYQWPSHLNRFVIIEKPA